MMAYPIAAMVKSASSNALGTPAARVRAPAIWTNTASAVGNVVGVVRRREPREVHPRPPHGEEDGDVGEQGVTELAAGEAVVQRVGRLGDGDDEAQVEEQLQRRRRPEGLVRVPTGHRPAPHVSRNVRLDPRRLHGRESYRLQGSRVFLTVSVREEGP